MEHVSKYEFQKCVRRYKGDRKIKTFSCWDQFLAMAFAQLTYRESLRDIEACLRAFEIKLYHMGMRGKISRSTLADANEKRDWKIYADFAQILIAEARTLYAKDDFGLELKDTVYALDSSTIDLCLSLFPWAKFRKHKGAVKLHTLLDLRGSIPTLAIITDGKVHDVNILDNLVFEPLAIYLMDRGYLDFSRLYKIHQSKSFFVTRAKKNFKFNRILSKPVDKISGIQCDQIIKMNSLGCKKYPEKLRRVRFFDVEENSRLVFLTNNFSLPALTIAQLYKCRWRVELFFKWIKQHLRIKNFYGVSENAVKTQIWIAISIYVLVAILKKHTGTEHSLYTILQILSVTLFEKTPILQVLSQIEHVEQKDTGFIQLNLFNL